MIKSQIFGTVSFLVVLLTLFTTNYRNEFYSENICPVYTDPVPVQYVGNVRSPSGVRVRLLVLKHCFEQMADGDAKMAIEAANLARTNGLDISDIGNYYITDKGQAQKVIFVEKIAENNLKAFISKQMKVNAEPGDTLIIMTIGHGMPQGDLQLLGQRQKIFHYMADAAEENNQETIWWQLSCYAKAKLPSIETLSKSQQSLFSVLPTADERTESPAYKEGNIMKKMFLSMAKRESAIDPDGDDFITAGELSSYLNKIEPGRGSLMEAASSNEILFSIGLARTLPIIDQNNKQGTYPKDYIQFPNLRDSSPIPKVQKNEEQILLDNSQQLEPLNPRFDPSFHPFRSQ